MSGITIKYNNNGSEDEWANVTIANIKEIIYNVNGVPDVNSPYLATINVANELKSVSTYGGTGYPTITSGNTYVVDTFIGDQR